MSADRGSSEQVYGAEVVQENLKDGSVADAGLIPASMVRKYAYCPRLFYLEFVHGEWSGTEDTVLGELVHRRVDEESGSLPPAQDVMPDQRLAARSVFLSAPRLGLSARIDLLEGTDGAVCPVDYKKGTPGPLGARDPEALQLCAYGLVLRENGYRCDGGVLYYAAVRQRVEVAFKEPLVSKTLEVLDAMRRAAASPVPPPPLVDSPKCPRCSLVGICLPDETAYLRGEVPGEVRRLVPARDDASFRDRKVTAPLKHIRPHALHGLPHVSVTARSRPH